MEPCLLAGSANPELARAIAERLGVPLGRATLRRFPDGEVHFRAEESVRGRDVYLIDWES